MKVSEVFLRKCALIALSLVAGLATLLPPGAIAPVAAERSGPVIALTFDDGPYAGVTSRILDALSENDAVATFFVLGSRVEGREETLKRMEEIGCEIGNHGYSHADLTTLCTADIEREIGRANEEFLRALGHEAALVRPPYGRYNDAVRRTVPYPLVLWTIDTEDWHSQEPAALAANVISKAKDGSVILMHDQQPSTAEAMETIITGLQREGYTFVTISELIEAQGEKCSAIRLPE